MSKEEIKPMRGDWDAADAALAAKGPGESLHRLFRVYHPVLDLAVDIDKEQTAKEYHIISKYMDMLVLGVTEDELDTKKTADQKVHIESKAHLFRLLGVDREAGEIADVFYNDLLAYGHFRETPEGLIGTDYAFRSVKGKKMIIPSRISQRVQVDNLSLRLIPMNIFEYVTPVSEEEVAAILNSSSNGNSGKSDVGYTLTDAVWIDARLKVPVQRDEIDRRIRSLSSELQGAEKALSYGLPTGFRRMSLSNDPDVTVQFYPYYLALYRKNGRTVYRVFDMLHCNRIPWMEDQYASSADYESARNRIESIAEEKDRWSGNPFLRNKNYLVANGTVSNGVFLRGDGNYRWRISQEQLELLMTKKRRVMKRALDAAVPTPCSTGKLVYPEVTPLQKRAIENRIAELEKERDEEA